MPLINCEITCDLNWSENCVIVATNETTQATTFSVIVSKFYGPFITLSTQADANLLAQLNSGFKRIINSNKYQRKVSRERVNKYLDFLIDPSFQGINRLFVLSFENEAQRTSYKSIILRLKKYNAMIDAQNFDQSIKINFITYDKIQKIVTSQGDDYTTNSLL